MSETVSSTRLVGEYSRVARPVGSDVRVAVPEWGEEQSGPWLVVPWMVVRCWLFPVVVCSCVVLNLPDYNGHLPKCPARDTYYSRWVCMQRGYDASHGNSWLQ